jgi:hypothetical protein
MQLIVLTGLVIVEKQQFTLDLARHYIAQGQPVAIIDNMARLTLDQSQIAQASYQRLEGDLDGQLAPLLSQSTAVVTILAASETLPPETLFVQLDALRDALSDISITTLALIDTRTCDCFPQVRQQLELYADVVVNMPADPAAVIAQL